MKPLGVVTLLASIIVLSAYVVAPTDAAYAYSSWKDALYIGSAEPGISAHILKVSAPASASETDRADLDTLITRDDTVNRLFSPAGLLIHRGELLVADQAAETAVAGKILRFDVATGAYLGVLVSDDPGVVFYPRGMVLKNQILYVADMFDSSYTSNGAVRLFSVEDGQHLGDLSIPEDVMVGDVVLQGNWMPRGIVFGPDGLLYVSGALIYPPSSTGGVVARFCPCSGEFLDIFFSSTPEEAILNRPEGVVFGPNGNMYITSFRDANNPLSVAQILVISGPSAQQPGQLLRSINLNDPGPESQAAYAQALIFGPQGYLYVAITGGAVTEVVRRYDVCDPDAAHTYEEVTPPSMEGLWYLFFGKSHPATLSYRPPGTLTC